MAKASFILVLGLVSFISADPNMYAATPPAKYPAPASTYTTPTTKYDTPAPVVYTTPTTKYDTPAPVVHTTTKYDTPAPVVYTTPTTMYETAAPMTTTAKYETPVKYEAEKPKYEEKKEEYPVKSPMKQEYKKEEYPPMKMTYGGKKYKRSIESAAKVDKTDDSKKTEDSAKLTRNVVQTVRDAVIQDLMSMMSGAINDEDVDLDGQNLANFEEEEENEQEMNEDDETFSPEMDSAMEEDDVFADNMDTRADPMTMKYMRILIKKRIQSKMCLRSPQSCGRPRPWVYRRPTIVKQHRYRPVRPSIIKRRCFWKRVCY